MGLVIRQSFKSATISYLGIIIGTLNFIYFFPRFLNTEEIGLIRLIQDIPFLFGSFFQLGTVGIATKFFPVFRKQEGKYSGFLFFLLIYPLFGFALFALLFLGLYDIWIGIYIKQSTLLVSFFYYILPLTFFMMYISIITAYLRIHFKITFSNIISDVYVRIFMSVNVFLYAFMFINFKIFIFLILFSYISSFILLLIYLYKEDILDLKPDYGKYSKSFLKETITFGAFVIIGSLGSLITAKIDILMLGSMVGLSLTGIYSIAFFIGNIMEVIQRSVSQISVPLISNSWKENRLDIIEDIYKKSSINNAIIGILIFLCIWCNIDSLFSLMPKGDIFKQGKYVVFFIAVGRIVDMISGLNGEIITYSKYYKFGLIATIILALLTVVTNLIFIPIYGITGAALATALSILFFNLIRVWFIYVKFKIQPFTYKVLILLIITLIVYTMIDNITMDLNFVLEIILRCMLIGFVYLLLVYVMKISPDVNRIIENVFRRIKAGF
jgi:O-antigen/teichoic acid export membrane protein